MFSCLLVLFLSIIIRKIISSIRDCDIVPLLVIFLRVFCVIIGSKYVEKRQIKVQKEVKDAIINRLLVNDTYNSLSKINLRLKGVQGA